ncbi:unnamed protein product [Microthlaspi erraticum]|uniref:Transposase MuDR plant domain-containing protein n=1 Tax=Microthlaspi erraticum TaxID=1685480 RepID=A0A6D2IJI7_9BRAS|nr:unnamed protein product [Microthlaspi erraticum]
MLQIYVTCGTWKLSAIKGWDFVADEAKGARVVALESTTTFEELKTTVLDDYSMESGLFVEFSYLPSDLINKTGSPRVVIDNDRQLKNFVGYIRKQSSKHLFVTFSDPVQNQNSGINMDFDDNPSADSFDGEDDDESKVKDSYLSELDDDEDDVRCKKREENEYKIHFSLAKAVKKKQEFRCKNQMKAHFEILAMKHNFDYRVLKSDTNFWTIRCPEKECNWGARAVNLKG